ncbi:hypothetical protein [Actinomadura rubrisoli]|uniref:hypothetical protein n=1 Tax=Actinomadura rubrisoli TaxID=2530368 RepID=UPI001A9E413D|nr:hypothetical protein [Actinomadura rubrisoli]
MSTVNVTVPIAGVVTFHRLDDTTTRVTARMEIAPDGLAEKAGDRLGALNRRVKGDLQRFKKFIEGRGVQTGGRRGKVDRPGP